MPDILSHDDWEGWYSDAEAVLGVVQHPAAKAEKDIAPRHWIPPTVQAPWHLQLMRDTCPLPAMEPVDNTHRLLEFQACAAVESRDDNAMHIADDGSVRSRFALSENDRRLMNAMPSDLEHLAAQLGRWRKGANQSGFQMDRT